MREAKSLQLVIDAAIADMIGAEPVGSTDVADVVIESNRDLIHSLAGELARKFVRRMVSDSMKKISAGDSQPEQGGLFTDMKGLPGALSIEVSGEVKYVARRQALRAQWHSHIEYLSKLIAADVNRKQMVTLANDRLEALRALYGDLSEDDLATRLRERAA